MWTMGPREPAGVVFTNFQDGNGWGSLGLATLIGMIGPTTTYLGADSAVHLAEELKDASYILPRAIFTASVINYCLGLITIITFMFAINDVEALLDSPTGQPWAQLIWNITGSKAATIVLILVMMVMVSCPIVYLQDPQLANFPRSTSFAPSTK
jgi:amino acid transporter